LEIVYKGVISKVVQLYYIQKRRGCVVI
jgi:hypothetical protein